MMKNKLIILILIGFCFNSQFLKAQAGVGTQTPDEATIFDIESDNKGILVPRIDLTSNTLDLDGDSYQPAGLLIYNVGNTFPRGYYFWNGTEWRTIESSSAIPPSITELLCDGASLSPAVYYNTSDYIGILKIPYKGGNGGRYVAGTPVTANGLTFQLEDGKLEIGSGELAFKVTGRPIQSSPVATTFEVNSDIIPFFNGNCTVKVGDQITADIKSVAVMAPLMYTDEGRNGYSTVITTPDGKYSIRCFVYTGGAFSNVNLQIRLNGTTNEAIMSNETWMWDGLGGYQHNQLVLTAGKWCGSGASVATSQTATVQDLTNFVAWGDPEVYALGRPEQRFYSFTSYDLNDKVFYNVRFMMGSTSPTALANSTTCPDGTCGSTKVFFSVEQITAP